MGNAPTVRRRTIQLSSVLAVLVALILVGTTAHPALADAYPVLPSSAYTEFLSGLSVAPLTPGGTGSLSFEAHDPLEVAVNGTTVTLQFYAFNPYPGNAPGALPVANAVAFAPVLGGPPQENVSFDLGTLEGGSGVAEAIPVQAPIAAAVGSYAVRTSVRFTVGGVSYLLESRGFFSDAAWANATTAPNGNATLNVSRLGVSGVTPETAVLVQSTTGSFFIWGLLVVSLVLAGLAAFYAFRRGRPGSRSGKRGEESPQSAPSALGNKRTKDGD